MQQYAGIYLLQNYFTYFGSLSHPSSGVHKTVTAASGRHHTLWATAFLQRGLIRPVSSSTPEMIERVRQIIREDRRRTIDEVSMLVGISHGACHKILTEDLKMRRVASKFVPALLSVDQKQQRLDVCLDLK